MPCHRRPGRSFSPAELDRYLAKLAATGNQTIAAEAIRRPVRSLRKRWREDPDFGARCEAALAVFRCSERAGGSQVAKGRRGELRTAGHEWRVTPRGAGGQPQLRRARKGEVTEAALALYLRTVAATANLSLAARSIGVSSGTMTTRRRLDLAFDQRVVEALKEGCQRLETQLLDSALRGLADSADDPRDSLSAEVEAAEARYAPQLPPMNPFDAFLLLQRQRELLSRPQKWTPERDRQIMELATARLEKVMRRMKLLPPGG